MRHVIFICFFFLSFALKAQENIIKWDYPVKPGMEKWDRLETEQERIDVLQVPERVLATLSPEEAVGLCITLPAFGLYTAWNTPQEGFVVMSMRYNILNHILSRKDVGGSLIAAYKDASLSGFKALPYSNDYWTIKLDYIELVLSQKTVLQSLAPEEKSELITEARSKLAEKLNNKDFSSIPSICFTVRIMASILDIENYTEFVTFPKRQVITQFTKTGCFYEFDDISMIDEIIRIADNYINDKK